MAKEKKKTADAAPETAAETMEKAAPAEETAKKPVKAEKKLAETEKKLNEAEQKLSESEKKLADMTDSLLRLRADFDNYRKRNAKLRTDSLEEGKAAVIAEMLKTLDNFERALNTDCADEGFQSGMRMIFNMMQSSLLGMGLEEIDTSGAFDPNFHEAVIREAAEGKESGSIVAVLQKGYTLNGKVIRAAMVKVAE